MTDTTETKRQRGRKVAAILAGGLVLGVGTMATLASWNDSEYANATFTAGKFVFQGSTDNSAWGDHVSSAGAASLAFTTPLVGKLTPNDTVGAAFAVRLGAGTTNGATVTLTQPSSLATGDNIGGLTYSVLQTTTFGCDAATTGTSLIASTAMGGGSATFPLVQPSGSNEGTPVFVCIKVKAGDSTVWQQTKTATATWLFSAQSN